MINMEKFATLPDEIKQIIYKKWYSIEKRDRFNKISNIITWLLENFEYSIKIIREPILEELIPFDYYNSHFALSNNYLNNIENFKKYLIEYIKFIHPKNDFKKIYQDLNNFFNDNMVHYQQNLDYHIFSKNNLYFLRSGIDNLTNDDCINLVLSVIYNCCINRKYNQSSYRILNNYCGDDEDFLDSRIYFKL